MSKTTLHQRQRFSVAHMAVCRLMYDDIAHTSEWLKKHTRHRPQVAIICGTGLGNLAELLEDTDVFLYKDIPNFPISTGTVCAPCIFTWH